MKNIYALLSLLFLVSFGSVCGQVDYNSGYPMLINVGETTVTIETEVNTVGYVTSFIILPDTDPIPTIQDVLDWSYDGNGGVLTSGTYGDIQPFGGGNANELYSFDVSGLTSESDYIVYLATSTDYSASSTIEQTTLGLSTPSQLTFSTLSAPGPDYNVGFPSVNNITETGVDVNTNINTSGYRTFVVVLSSLDAAPTIQEVIDWGRTGNGGTLPSGTYGFVPSGRNPGAVDTDYNVVITGLIELTDYIVYVVSSTSFSDADAIEVGTPNAIPFKTSGPITIDSYSPAQNAVDVPINQNLELVFNQDIELVSPAPFTDAVYVMEQGTGREIQKYQFSPGTANPNLIASGNTFTVNLTQNLDASTATYITIPGGFIQTITGETFGGINNAEDNNWRFTTTGGPSWTSDYPYADQAGITYSNVDVYGQTDMGGTYIYVVTDSDVFPTIAEIKSGTASGTIVTNQAQPGTMTANTNFVESIDISNAVQFIPNTTYYVYMVATDDVFNLDSPIARAEFTTLEIDPPVATSSPGDGEADVSVYSTVVITYDEPVRMTNGTIIDNSNVAQLVSKFQLNPANDVTFTATIDASKRVITIVPDVILNDNSGYDVAIFPVEDYLGNEQTDPFEFSFSTGNYVVWSGATSSDWTVNQNWDGNFTNGANVLIPASATNMPVLSTNESVTNMAIEAGASLTINTTGVLSVSGIFDLLSSNVSGVGNASLLNEGALNVIGSNVNVEQAVTSSPTKWYFLSSPVGGATQTNINCDGRVYEYDINSHSWPEYGANTIMGDAVGYKVYSYQNMSFSGDINNGDSYSFGATRTSVNAGWNLAGNPYPCSIDWNALDLGTSGLTNGFWVWLNDSQQYGTYNGNAELGTNLSDLGASLIPSNHAFWVKVPIGEVGGTLTIPNTARTHNDFTYLKSLKSSNQGVLRLLAVDGDKTDEAIIAFNEGADDLIDGHDSQKRFASSYANQIEIFTIAEGSDLSINSYKEFSGNKIIDLGVKSPKDGVYRLALKSIANFSSDIEVKIEDQIYSPSKFIELTEDSYYEFELAEGTDKERLKLHISQSSSTPTDIPDVDANIRIYSHESTIYLDLPSLNNASYEVYTIGGKVISQGLLQGGVINKVQAPVKGMLIVKVLSDQATISTKVFVK